MGLWTRKPIETAHEGDGPKLRRALGPVQLVALGVAGPRVLKLGKTGPKPLHAVPLCNQDGKIRSIFLHKKNLQISYAIPLGGRATSLAAWRRL